MPKHMKKMKKGGFNDYNYNYSNPEANGISGYLSNVKKNITNWLSTSSPYTSSNTQSSYSSPSYSSPSSPSYSYGGRKKTNRRKHRGGFTANTPSNGIASHAGSFVGGKTHRRKRGHASSKRRH
jgi:hypothetical protein